MTHAVASSTDVRSDDITRIVLRPLATPLPLGFLALAIGSCLLTSLQLDWVPATEGKQVATAVLALVVPLQFLAAIMSFLIRDVVMATGFGLLTGSWAATGMLLRSAPPGATSKVVGVLAICGGVALLVPAVTAAWSKPVATVLMVVAAARFASTGVYELTASNGWANASAGIGILLIATALYGSLGLAIEDARHQQVLPVNRVGTSRRAMSGDLGDQLVSLPTEAGVRRES